MAKLMTSINQIEGGDVLKSGDTTSVFGFEILGYDGKRMELSGTGKLTLSNDETVALYQDVTTEFAQAVGEDIKEIKGKQSSSLSISQAYGLFPTYNNFFLQVMEQNKFVADPLVTKSQLPTNEIDTLKQKIEELERTISEIKQSIQK